MTKQDAATNDNPVPHWDRENRTKYGTLKAPTYGGRTNHCTLSGEATEKGEFPPRFRIVVECQHGPHRGETLMIEDTKDGRTISNQGMFSDLGPEAQDMLSGLAETGKDALISGWNSGLKYGYEKGVEAEKARAAAERAQQGQRSRAIHDAVQAEARETGRDPSEIGREHVERLVRERGNPKQAGGQGVGS